MDVAIANNIDCTNCAGALSMRGRPAALQTADGRLEDVTATHLPQLPAFTHNIAAADIDGDGDMDLYLANFFFHPSRIYLNDGRGRFTVGESNRLPAVVGASGFAGLAARFIDVNRDGRPDLYIGLNESGTPRDLLLLNDGRGFFTLSPDYALPNRYGGRDWGTVCTRVVDFDGDGWPDLINCVYGGFYAEGAVQILLNNHDGTFRDATGRIVQPAWEPRESPAIKYLDPVVPGDFNGDGFLDLLVHGSGQPSRLFLNTGPAGGGRLVDVSELLPDAAGNVSVADFNRDGALDVAGWLIDCCTPMFLETWLNTRKFSLTPDLIPPLPPGPFFLGGSVLNSASFLAGAVAPGELVTIFGRDLGPSALTVATPAGGRYPSELAGTRVLVNGFAAPIIYAAAGQVSAVVPFSVIPESRADMVVEYQGLRSPPVSISVSHTAPGLFTLDGSGAGPGALLNVDTVTGAVSVNSPQNPSPRGGVIVAYITGAGRTDPPTDDGVVASTTGRLALTVNAGLDSFGGTCRSNPNCTPVEVLYAGPAPGLVAGVIQVNLRLPASVSGVHPLGISVGGVWTQSNVTVSIR